LTSIIFEEVSDQRPFAQRDECLVGPNKRIGAESMVAANHGKKSWPIDSVGIKCGGPFRLLGFPAMFLFADCGVWCIVKDKSD